MGVVPGTPNWVKDSGVDPECTIRIISPSCQVNTLELAGMGGVVGWAEETLGLPI